MALDERDALRQAQEVFRKIRDTARRRVAENGRNVGAMPDTAAGRTILGRQSVGYVGGALVTELLAAQRSYQARSRWPFNPIRNMPADVQA
jgi:hypothetical protein